LAPAEQCHAIKNLMSNGCSKYPKSCRFTCRKCTPCSVPKQELKCTTSKQNISYYCKYTRERRQKKFPGWGGGQRKKKTKNNKKN